MLLEKWGMKVVKEEKSPSTPFLTVTPMNDISLSLGYSFSLIILPSQSGVGIARRKKRTLEKKKSGSKKQLEKQTSIGWGGKNGGARGKMNRRSEEE